jgi:phosphate starvation-inducible PhoH-like protein
MHNNDLNQSTEKKIKGQIKFLISLNDEQKSCKTTILNSKITVVRGLAGSGKTLIAAQVALDMLFRKEVDRIVLTRPAVSAGEDLGYLPGDKDEKLSPFTAAIYDNMNALYDKDKIQKEIQEGKIEVIPLAFMRGRNLKDCLVVVDEAQNITHKQMKMLLGRICIGTKMILCGDVAQIDLKDEKTSGYDFICNRFNNVKGFSVVTLKTNHRDPIVEELLEIYKQYEN